MPDKHPWEAETNKRLVYHYDPQKFSNDKKQAGVLNNEEPQHSLFFRNDENAIQAWLLALQERKHSLDPQTGALAAMMIELSHNLVSPEQSRLLNLVFDQLEAAVGYQRATVAKLEGDQLTVLAYRGPGSEAETVGKGVSAAELWPGCPQQPAPLAVSKIQHNSPQAQALQKLMGGPEETPFSSLRSSIIIPLIFKEQPVGVLALGHNKFNYYSPQQVELVVALANFVALSLGNSQIYEQARNMAAMQERNRLARELHDNVAQTLGYLSLKISATETLLSNGQVAEAQANLRELKQIVGDVYTDVREEIFNLRAKVSSGLGFLETLRRYIAKYKKYYNLDIQLIIDVEESSLEFPVDVGGQVIRIIQEALINVRKHAGVNKACIRFRQEEGRIQISIEDRGQGFDLSQIKKRDQTGFGLQIMRERAQSIGGNLKIKALSGSGVQIVVWVPVSGK